MVAAEGWNATMANERVIAYTRVSSQAQATSDKSSHEYQEERIRSACKTRGYTVIRVMQEVDKRWELDRPELNTARQMFRDGKADVLMAMTMDRLSSELAHLYIFMTDIESHRGRIEYADQEYEDDWRGEFLRNMAVTMGKVEIETKSNRSRQGHDGAALNGLPVGRRPLGYQIVGKKRDRHLKIDDGEVPLVRRIFNDVADGVALRQLILALEQGGYKTSLGNVEWWPDGIRRIIHNETYKGEFYGHKSDTRREKVNGKTKPVTRARPKSERGPMFPCPPIVSADLWQRANDRLDLNAASSSRNNKSPETHLLRRPFGVCGECGYSLQAIAEKKGRKARYRCGNTLKNQCPCPSILRDDLDAEVWERVELVINSPGQALQAMVDQVQDGTLDARIAELETTVAKLTKRVSGLVKGIARAWSDDDESLAEGLTAERKPLDKTLADSEQELAELLEQARRQEELRALPTELEAIAKGHAEAFHSLGYKAKQNLMHKLNIKAELGTGLPDSRLPRRTRITMQLTPDLLYGWDGEKGEEGEWDFDAEDLIGEALLILNPGELTIEDTERIAKAQARLTPEQRKANKAFLDLTPEERRRTIGKCNPSTSATLRRFAPG